MKKKILGLAMVAMSLTAFSSLAQNPSACDNGGTCVRKECVKNDKSGKPCDKKCKPGMASFYEGLTLTDAQKARLEQLEARRKAARDLKKNRAESNDSTRMADVRAERKSYLEEVKAIVGPEQYVVFLENIFVNGGGNNLRGRAVKTEKRQDKMGKGRDMRGGKPGKKFPGRQTEAPAGK